MDNEQLLTAITDLYIHRRMPEAIELAKQYGFARDDSKRETDFADLIMWITRLDNPPVPRVYVGFGKVVHVYVPAPKGGRGRTLCGAEKAIRSRKNSGLNTGQQSGLTIANSAVTCPRCLKLNS